MSERHIAQTSRRIREALGIAPTPRTAFRRQAQRDRLTALGTRARRLVKTCPIREIQELLDLSRPTLYRAMRLSLDAEARERSMAVRAIGTDGEIDPLLL